MTGTKEGGRKASATNRLKYGDDFYKRIGKKGGEMGHTGGFYANRELAREAGRKGGHISRRGPAKQKPIPEEEVWTSRISKFLKKN